VIICASHINARPVIGFHTLRKRFHRLLKTRPDGASYLALNTGGAAMGFPRLQRPRYAAATVLLQTLASSHAAFASQGPGGAAGTAGPLTQLVMAIIVYGGSALILAAGLIGSLRRKS
jgi:hypothetical protein